MTPQQQHRRHCLGCHFHSLVLQFICIACSIVSSHTIKTRLTWVNGIGHSLEHMKHGQGEISKLFGGQAVAYCHNPTAMTHPDDYLGLVGDLSQATTQKLGRITQEVTLLVQHLRQALLDVGRYGLVVHIAHSQGALVTALAVRQLTLDEMKRIEIISFGGATVLTKSPVTPFRRCINYYATNDPLLLLVPSAQEALRSGFFGLYRGTEDDTEFCFLAPREGDPIADHGLLGKTYGQALAWEGLRFQRKYQSALYRTVRTLVVMIMTMLHMLHTLLLSLVHMVVRQLLMVCIANYKSLIFLWELVKSRILPPILLSLVILADWIVVMKQRITGEHEYLPVLNQASS